MKRKSVDEEDAGGRFRQGKGLRGLSGMTVDLAPFYSTMEAFVIKWSGRFRGEMGAENG